MTNSKVQAFVGRWCFWLSMKLSLYSIWSRIYQWLFERKDAHYPLPTFETFYKLALKLYELSKQYRRDSFMQLGDACSHPSAFWARFRRGEKVGDCEDFANAIASFIQNSEDKKVWKEKTLSSHVLIVAWLKDGKWMGHGVCLLSRVAQIPGAQILDYGYMDYGFPVWESSIERVVETVRRAYAGPSAVGQGWAILEPKSLKVLRVERT